MITNLSVRTLVVAALSLLTLMSAIVLGFVSQHFYDSSLQHQQATLARIAELSTNQQLEELEQLAVGVSQLAQKSREFKAAMQQNDRLAMREQLNQSFRQGAYTSGQVDLIAVRAFDLQFQLLASSSAGRLSPSPALDTQLLAKMQGREGAERFKQVSALWRSEQEPLYSLVVPLGGLRLSGYLEVILAPAHNFIDVGKSLHVPAAVKTLNDTVLMASDDWEQAAQSPNYLPVNYVVKSESGQPVMALTLLENIAAYRQTLATAKYASILVLVILMMGCAALLYYLFAKQLITPMHKLGAQMRRCAEGDLAITISAQGLSEPQQIARGLATMITSMAEQVRQIDNCADALNEASQRTLHIVEQTKENAVSQCEASEQAAAAVTQMACVATEVAGNTARASTEAQSAQQLTQRGLEQMAALRQFFARLSDDVSTTTATIEQVGIAANRIGGVVDVIRDIAEQTNLLALNASIEAARAGEQGRGFAVVADEVRNLASRTQASTREIQSMIESLQKDAQSAVDAMGQNLQQVTQGVERADDVDQALANIAPAVDQIGQINLLTATASDEQSQVAGSISASVQSIVDLARATTDKTAHGVDACEELSQLAQSLKNVVKHFSL